MRRRKGQSILEYLIVLTAIVAAVAYGAATVLRPALVTDSDSAFNNMSNAIKLATQQIPVP